MVSSQKEPSIPSGRSWAFSRPSLKQGPCLVPQREVPRVGAEVGITGSLGRFFSSTPALPTRILTVSSACRGLKYSWLRSVSTSIVTWQTAALTSCFFSCNSASGHQAERGADYSHPGLPGMAGDTCHSLPLLMADITNRYGIIPTEPPSSL